MPSRFTSLLSFPLILAVAFQSASADTVPVGKGSYRTDLPPGPDGKARRSVEADPLISDRVSGPIPTSDWWSSLVWPMHSPHSMAMFPHPLAVQASEDGLGIGYTSAPVISDHLKDGKVFQTGTNYRYPFRQSLLVGLDGVKTESTLLDGFSDWAVTALWKKDADELRATFAHGSPFVFFEKKSERPLRIRFSAAKINTNREPVDPYSFEWKGITGTHSGKTGSFSLAMNAGKNAGIGSKARLVYDYDGDGKTDQVEIFSLFATDPVLSSWEIYSSEKQKLDAGLSRGEPQDFKNGSVRLEFWKCFGKGPVQLKLEDCRVSLPFADGADKVLKEQAGSKGEERGIVTVGAADKAPGAGRIFYTRKNVIGVTLNGSHFAIFSPTGAQWTGADIAPGKTVDSIASRLAGKDYLSVAVVPDEKPATIQWFQKRAYAFLRDTRISFRYEAKTSSVTTTYSATTEAKEGTGTDTVFALYRHQHLHASEKDRFEKFSYASPRGEMKVYAGKQFSTVIPFLGVLPALPLAAADKASLAVSLEADFKRITSRNWPFEKDDTYWNGKEFGKFSELIQIAEQLGKSEIRDRLLALLKERIADWLEGRGSRFFYYDKRWGTLTGYPDSYGSGEQLNDHHFHYSYFIKAAATIAQYDPGWVNPDQYGGMIDALIRDCANPDRSDKRFPWMRNLDSYAGHSWAAGHAGFGSGNNQESSSESMNFATALVLYGQITKRDDIRDLGIYWHSTEAEAIRHYWFDEDETVFPDGYRQACVGMVWGDGASYGTWWTANPEEIHGINFLPLNGGSLYLGRNTEYVRRNFANLESANRNFHKLGFPGDPDKLDRWQDILCEYIAFADPADALQRYQDLGKDHGSEFGETKTHTLQWLGALKDLGIFDSKTSANHPLAVAFLKNGKKSYIVFNETSNILAVRFSDGKVIKARPGLSVSR